MNPYAQAYGNQPTSNDTIWTSAEEQYRRGRCVVLFGYAMNEPIPSPTTAVGSPRVALDSIIGDRRYRNNQSFVPCTLGSGVCPRALPATSDPTIQVNIAAPYLASVSVHAINKRSLLKAEAWCFISYLLDDECAIAHGSSPAHPAPHQELLVHVRLVCIACSVP